MLAESVSRRLARETCSAPRCRTKVTRMSGFLILLLATVLSGEILPAPAEQPKSSLAHAPIASSSEALPPPSIPREALPAPSLSREALPAPSTLPPPSGRNTRLISTTTEASTLPMATDDCKVGWGIDSADGTMYMVIQIAPSALENFAAGQRGQELQSRIPPVLRNRIEKVIIRFGTGPVEQVPPESELVGLPLSSSNTPHLANLDMRTPVDIDAPRGFNGGVVPTAASTQVPVFPSTSSVPPGSSSFGSQPSTSPTFGSDPRVAAPPPWNNNTSARTTSGTIANDGFVPQNPSVPPTLNPFGSSRSGNASPGFPSTSAPNGNVTYGSTSYNANNVNAPNFNGANANPLSSNPNGYGGVPLIASNPNADIYPPNTNATQPLQPQGNFGQQVYSPNPPMPSTSGQSGLMQNAPSNYGMNVSTGNPPYATAGYGNNNTTLGPPMLTVPQLANRTTGPSANELPVSNIRDRARNRDAESSDVLNSTGPGNLVPFFLVLSFILNVYFGLWLNHLRTKYRHLLGSMRGISPMQLDRA